MLIHPIYPPLFCRNITCLVRISVLLLCVLLLPACTSKDTDLAGKLSKNVPQGIIANAGTRLVELSWNGVVGANSYTVYWSNQPGVTPRTGVVVTTQQPYLRHEGLSNGSRYYYIISSSNISGESSASNEVSALPFAAVPEAPLSVKAIAGDGRVNITWQPVAGASRYSIYWSNNTAVSMSDTRIDNAVSPLVHSGLNNGSMYYYIVVAENATGEGAASLEVQGQPTERAPTTPVITDAIIKAAAVELQWQDVSAGINSSTEYDLYWNNAGNVTSVDAVISGVTSPYRHAPLSANLDYYYRIRARNSGGISGLSNSAHIKLPSTSDISPLGNLPATPISLLIGLGNGQLTMSWNNVDTALAYNLYWTESATEVLSLSNPLIRKINNIKSPYTHIKLNNGTKYRYVLSAINDFGESGLSAENSGSPEVIKPGVPAGVRADGGDEWIAVRWAAVDQALSYDVYITDSITSSEQLISNAISPQRADATTLNGGGVVNGKTYNVEVVANNLNTISTRSVAVEATPHEPPPQAPSQLTAEPGDAEVQLRWLPALPQNAADADELVTNYRVYFGTREGVTRLNGTLIPALDAQGQANYVSILDGQGNEIWQLRHSGLSNGQRYYYIVTAENIGGESRSSNPAWTRPQINMPNIPNNIWVEAGDDNVTMHFSEVITATVAYNLYWNKLIPNSTGSNRTATQVITNISPGYVFQEASVGNTNGNTYYFRLTTVNAAGESNLSAEVSASPQVPAPKTAPRITVAEGQQSQISLSWTLVSDADAYALYWSTESDIDAAVSARISGIDVQPGYVHAGLTNGQSIYYQVVAVNAGGESALSNLVVAMPQWDVPAKPRNVIVTAGDAEVLLNFSLVPTATSYTLYWDAEPVDAALTNWSSRTVAPSTRITNLINGQLYQFQLLAHNAGGSSVASDGINATPIYSAPASPLGFSIAPGESQVSLQWMTRVNEQYTLYWTTDTNPANLPINSGNQQNDVRPTYVDSGLANGTAYRYQLTATHINPVTGLMSGPTSAPTPVVSGAPAAIIQASPQALRALAGDTEIALSWLPPATGSGPYTYSLYWSDTAGQGKNGLPITNISSTNYLHIARSNNQSYYYVVTATDTNSGNESVASLPASARPQTPVPAQVLGVWVTPSDGQNTVRWQAVAQASQYRLEWSTQVDSNNALIAPINVVTPSVLAPQLDYVHSPLVNGETIYYRVSAQNNNGAAAGLLSGLASAAVAGTPQAQNNQAPQIKPNVDTIGIVMDEDSSPLAFALALEAVDTNGDTLTWTVNSSGTRGTAAIIGTGTTVNVTYTPVPDENVTTNGTDEFKVQVSDGKGGVDNLTVVVTITAQNDAPVFNSTISTLGTRSDLDGATVSLNAGADDIDGPTLIYSATGLPTGLGIDAVTGEISGSLSNTASLNSSYSVILTVDDQDLLARATDTVNITWVVNPISADPNFSSVSIVPATGTAQAGTNVVITVTARDSSNNPIVTGGETVALTITGANENLTAATPLVATDNNDGTYTISYTPLLTGTDLYTLNLNPAGTIVGSYSMLITPSAASTSNSFAQIPAGSYTAGQMVTLEAQINDAGNNSTTGLVTFEIVDATALTSTLTGVAQGGGVYQVAYTPTLAGTESLKALVNGAVITMVNGTATATGEETRNVSAAIASATDSNATIPLGPYTEGQAVMLQAQVFDAYGNLATGSVTFKIVNAATQTFTVIGVAQGAGLYQEVYTTTQAGTITISSLVDGVAIGVDAIRTVNGVAKTIYYVKKTANDDLGDGLSIATAKKTIPGAIAVAIAPADIRVSSGIYSVNSDTRNAIQTHIVIKDGVSLYGGYTLDFSKRLPASQITLIEDICTEVRVAPLFPCRAMEVGGGVTASTIIDGFTIRGSTGNFTDYTSAIVMNSVGGVVNMGPTLQNNIIYGGGGSNTSYGILTDSASPIIQYNKINGGSGVSASYGMRITRHTPVIQFNTINGGTGGSGGGLGGSSVGIYHGLSTPRIRKNVIIAGGGASCDNSYGIESRSSASSNTIIEDNTIYAGNGLIKSVGIFNVRSYAIIRRNLIYGGNATTSYGIDASTLGSATEFLSIINNVIHGGSGSNASYGINNSSQSDNFIRNNIIDGGSGGGVAYGISNNSVSSSPTIENNIIYASSAINGYCIFENGLSATPKSVRNNNLYSCNASIYSDANSGCGTDLDGDGNPATCTLAEMEALTDFSNGASGNVSIDPLFVDKDGHDNNISTLEDNDWRFSGVSPVSVTTGGLNGIDMGGWGYTADKDRAARLGSGKPWAMGAYDTTATYYVSSTAANDTGDGRSPATAKRNITAAIAAASAPAIIRVNAGIYSGDSTTGVLTHVILREGISLSGGHSPNFSRRDAALFTSQIVDTGSVAGGTPPNRSIEASIGITTATIVEGFTITGSSSANAVYTSAVYTNNASPTFRNNRIHGGGKNIAKPVSIYNNGVSKGVFINNYIESRLPTPSSPVAIGILNLGSSPLIQYNSISSEFAIDNRADSQAIIVNNLIYAIRTAISNDNAHPVLRNNTMYSNIGIYATRDSMPVIENNIININQVANNASVCIISDFGKTPAAVNNNDLFGCVTVYSTSSTSAVCGGPIANDCTLSEMESLFVFGLSNATGNTVADPVLVNLNGADGDINTMNDNDWHIQATTSVTVREGGLNFAAELPANDFDGASRTAIEVIPTIYGGGWSMGAYEQD